MRVSEQLRDGASLPREDWRGMDPRTRVVPAKKGRKAPYQRQARRRRESTWRTEYGSGGRDSQ